LKATDISIPFYQESAVFNIQKKMIKAGQMAFKLDKNTLDYDTYSE